MNTAPAISVVIPLYNKAGYIHRCVDSIKAQRFPDFEVVVMDDGSTDSSFADFNRAVAGDARFRVLQQPNGGVSRARNAAIAAAVTPWIAFLDADDEWHPDFLAEMHALIGRHPEVVMAGSGYDVIHANAAPVRRCPEFANPVVDVRSFFRAWESLGGCPLFIGATLARRDAIQAQGGFTPGMNLGEELLLFIRLMENGRLAFVSKPLARYHLSSEGSLASSPRPAAIRSHSLLVNEIGRQVRLGNCAPAVHTQWQEIHAEYLIQSGMRKELVQQVLSKPWQSSARTWMRAAAETLGLRSGLRRLTGRS